MCQNYRMLPRSSCDRPLLGTSITTSCFSQGLRALELDASVVSADDIFHVFDNDDSGEVRRAVSRAARFVLSSTHNMNSTQNLNLLRNQQHAKWFFSAASSSFEH